MFPKRILWFLAVFTALIVTLSVTTLAQAGGWAVITLDRLPQSVTAGEPYQLGFMVRQHGRTPWQVEEIPISARPVDGGKRITFSALPDEVPGHYTAELLFPKSGAWEWSIESGLYPQGQPMPVLQVAAAGVPAEAGVPAAVGAPAAAQNPLPSARAILSSIPGSLLGVLALLALAAGLALLLRVRRRLGVFAGAGLLVLSGALAFAFFTSVGSPGRAAAGVPVTAAGVPAEAGVSADAGVPAEADQAATGKQLFLAKGCVVCHTNNRALQNSAEFGVNMGPNLSAYHNDPGYLRKFLASPSAVKPSTEMPTLGLSPAEIDALVAFINSDN